MAPPEQNFDGLRSEERGNVYDAVACIVLLDRVSILAKVASKDLSHVLEPNYFIREDKTFALGFVELQALKMSFCDIPYINCTG